MGEKKSQRMFFFFFFVDINPANATNKNTNLKEEWEKLQLTVNERGYDHDDFLYMCNESEKTQKRMGEV